MRINPISSQNFKAFIKNPSTTFTKEQNDVIEDIMMKSKTSDEKLDNQSLLGMLKMDYDIDLYAESHSDKKSINLYFAENNYLKNEFADLPRLTPIGTFNKDNKFDTLFAIDQIDNMAHGKNRSLVNTLATLICALGIVIVPIASIASLIKDRNAQKIENIVKHTTDTLKNTPKDTLNLAKKIIK